MEKSSLVINIDYLSNSLERFHLTIVLSIRQISCFIKNPVWKFVLTSLIIVPVFSRSNKSRRSTIKFIWTLSFDKFVNWQQEFHLNWSKSTAKIDFGKIISKIYSRLWLLFRCFLGQKLWRHPYSHPCRPLNSFEHCRHHWLSPPYP